MYIVNQILNFFIKDTTIDKIYFYYLYSRDLKHCYTT